MVIGSSDDIIRFEYHISLICWQNGGSANCRTLCGNAQRVPFSIDCASFQFMSSIHNHKFISCSYCKSDSIYQADQTRVMDTSAPLVRLKFCSIHSNVCPSVFSAIRCCALSLELQLVNNIVHMQNCRHSTKRSVRGLILDGSKRFI